MILKEEPMDARRRRDRMLQGRARSKAVVDLIVAHRDEWERNSNSPNDLIKAHRAEFDLLVSRWVAHYDRELDDLGRHIR